MFSLPADTSRRTDIQAAARIAVIYLLVAAIWILLSDRVLEAIVGHHRLERLLWLQTVKGLAFVVITAGLLMLLVSRRLGQTREAERTAADTQQRLRAFADHFPGIVYIRDQQRRFVLLSGQFPAEVVPERYIGKTDESLHSPETFERLTKRDGEVIATGNPTQLLETVTVGGRTLHYLVHRFPMSSPMGERWVAGLGIDITERQQAEERIREMARELAEANRMKDQFLTNLSHELRTPITAIRLWAEVLRNPSPDDMETIREAVSMIQHSAMTQTLLIEDLLDVTRIIGGKLRVEASPMNLDEVLRNTVELLLPMAQEHGVSISQHIVPRGPCRMLGDSRRVQQVIWNLLTNAIKFSNIDATVTCLLTRGPDEWVITVEDRGRGISAQQLPHVFDRFRQADPSRGYSEGGIGIGLSIVKHLVEAHGGAVRAESAGEGQGATFIVQFPAIKEPVAALPAAPAASAADAESPQSDPQRTPLEGRRVLVVEDDADSRSAMTLLFRRAGADVTAVESAEAALSQDGPFDLLLSDIGLPERDGCALIRELRGRSEWKDVPAVACSAYALPEDKTRAFESGFNDFVIKPVDADELIQLMADRLSRGIAAR